MIELRRSSEERGVKGRVDYRVNSVGAVSHEGH
jgi:hypothetical protein